MKLITEVFEDIKILKEEKKDGKKDYYIEGVFMQGDLKNRNGRVYPMEVLKKETDRYIKEYVEKNRAYGELGHPQGPSINLERVSHLIKELRYDGTNVIGKAKIMDTPYGNIVKNLMDEGAVLGVSSRGMGSIKDVSGSKQVQDDFYLATAADIVADPSAPDAFVQGIMEGVEWVWDNGIIKEVQIAEYKKQIDESARHLREEMKIKAFQDFLSKL